MTPTESLMNRRSLLGTLAVLAFPASLSKVLAAPQGPRREVVIVEKANEILIEMTKNSKHGVPLALLHKAQGVILVPDLVRAGFVFGAEVGRGVLMSRDESGGWSYPLFLGMAGGSFGAQIGASASDLMLVFTTKKSVDDFLSHNKVTLGADIAVAAGPIGREAGAGTDLKMRAEILSYSRSRGLFAGVSIEGTSLHVRHRANDAFYGHSNMLVGDILAGKDSDDKALVVPPSAARLRATLDALCKPPKSKIDDPLIEKAEGRPKSNTRNR